MNLSALFIKRPVTTTLIMLGHHRVRRDGVPAAAGQRPADRRLPHHPGRRGPAGREPGDDGVGGGAAAREAVRDDCRPELDQLDQLAGQHEHHAAVRPEPQHRRRRAGRAGDDREGGAPAAAADAGAAVVPEGQPGRPAGAVPGAALGDAAAVDRRRVRRDDDRAAHLDGQRRRAGQRVRRGEVRGARRRRPAQARGARHRHRRGRDRDRERERQPADRHDVRRDKTFAVQANGQLLRAAAYGADDRRLPERQPGAARRGRARLRRHRERQERRLVQRRARRSTSPSRSSRAPTSSRSSTRSRRCCRRSASSCRRRSSLDVRTDRSVADPRVGRTTSSSRCC